MEQEKILSMILSKLDNIEKDQKEMKKEQQKMNNRFDKLEQGQEVIKKDIKEIKSIQKTIQEFMLSTEKAIEKYEQDHIFIEKFKKVAGE
ncbi:hypothetical protein [Maledivibacter halophilus]|uniref:Uncharacterized protein n=1 Tax=Maledivibacter halophilus TaxID=36842 RepID=A0A1T5K1C1_9FIRM|nr:hypothetical protein [Maledivibacter halophilus]SKC57340.1 hypothetical protein SAMN02194393_01532 [Maledivibacter halophilus]